MFDGSPTPITPRTLYRAVLLAFALFVVVALFSELIGLLVLLLLAAIVAVPLSAAADRLERLHVPRAVGVPATLVFAIAVIAGVVTLLVPTFVHEGTKFVDSLPATVRSLNSTIRHASGAGGGTNLGHTVQKWVDGYTKHPQRLLGPATTVASTVTGAVTAALVVLFTAMFAAIYPRPLHDGIVRLAPPRHRPRLAEILGRLASAYLGWLAGLVVGMTVLGTLTYAGLTAIGLPYALVFAVLTALASVVPYYGALLSYIPPIALALTISPGKALLVLAISLAVHFIEGMIVEPLIMARAVRLHPALVAAGVIIVERLLGFAGLFVAVPVLATVKILVEEVWIRSIEDGEGVELEPARPPPPPLLVRRWQRPR
jgi:predicted PurR-regulated permease PerM